MRKIADADVDQFVDLIDGIARSMDCIRDVYFDGRSYMLSLKIMSGAFRDLVAASHTQMYRKERAAKPPQTFENEYRRIERSQKRERVSM